MTYQPSSVLLALCKVSIIQSLLGMELELCSTQIWKTEWENNFLKQKSACTEKYGCSLSSLSPLVIWREETKQNKKTKHIKQPQRIFQITSVYFYCSSVVIIWPAHWIFVFTISICNKQKNIKGTIMGKPKSHPIMCMASSCVQWPRNSKRM